MSYFDRPVFSDDPASLSGLGCGADCSCASCRTAQAQVNGLGCGSDCSCKSCRDVTARLGERYIPDDEDEDDAPAPGPNNSPRAQSVPAGNRAGLNGWGGYGGWGFGEGGGGGAGTRVVFIPGIMGSALSATVGGGRIPIIGRTAPSVTLPVWGTTAMLAAFTGPLQLAAWRSAMASGNGINNGGSITPSGLTNIRLPGGRSVDPYSSIMADLNSTFGAGNVMAFPYDWRLANEHNASLLRAAILRRWPDATTNRVTLICHSMGGLLARALVELRSGTGLVQRVITVGTPHFGAPEALSLLSNITTSRMVAPLIGPIGMVAGALVSAFATMVRDYASVTQLLPGYDFFTPRGASANEPISRTYARFRSDAAWGPVFGGGVVRGPRMIGFRGLNRSLIGGVAGLNARLAAAGVRYDTIAAVNHDTAVSVQEMASPVVRAVRSPCGDGTVPVSSAALPAGSNISPLFINSPQDHSNLFLNGAVRRLCIDLARGATVGSTTPQPSCASVPPARSGLEGMNGYGCPGCVAAAVQQAGVAGFAA